MSNPGRILRTIALAAPVLLAPGCGDDDGGPGPGSTLLVTGTFLGSGGVVVVTDGGVAVTGAEVTVNGTDAVAGGVAGEYDVTLAPPVAAGGTLTLAVGSGGALVGGTAAVPATPALTAPEQDAVFSNEEDIEVTWTSATDPDRWVVEASDGIVALFDVPDGSARSFPIPGGSLEPDVWEIRVLAYNDGALTGDTEAGSTMAVRAAVATSPTVVVVQAVRVQTVAFTGAGGGIGVTQAGIAVDGATVTVNGEAAVQDLPGTNYHVDLAAPVAAGGNIDLDIAFGDVVIEGLGTVPEAPVVTAPLDGASFPAVAGVNVTWTSTADASGGWVVTLYDGVDVFEVSNLNPAARSVLFQPLSVPDGTYEVTVYAFNAATLTGPVSIISTMNIRNENAVKPEVTITP